MTELVIELPATLQSWTGARLADGEYVDGADYLRDLVRRDRWAVERRWSKAMIDEGLASGVCEADAFETLDRIMAEDPDLRA